MQLHLRTLLAICLLASMGLGAADAYRILFMGPFPAPSHWLWLEHFQRDLLQRGHHVTSVNNHPTKMPHENLTEIILSPSFDIPKHCEYELETEFYEICTWQIWQLDSSLIIAYVSPRSVSPAVPKKNIFSMQFASDFQNLQMWWQIGLMTTEHALQDVKLRQLIESQDEHYDLVILEQFFHEAFLMFGHKFSCPVVTIGTMGYADNMDHAMGILTPWSFIPHLLLSHTDKMTFSQRAYNAYLSLYDAVMRRWYYLPKMQQLAEKYFGTALKGGCRGREIC